MFWTPYSNLSYQHNQIKPNAQRCLKNIPPTKLLLLFPVVPFLNLSMAQEMEHRLSMSFWFQSQHMLRNALFPEAGPKRERSILFQPILLIPPVDAVFTISQTSCQEQMQTLCLSCSVQVISPEKLHVSFQQKKIFHRCIISSNIKHGEKQFKILSKQLCHDAEENSPSKRKNIKINEERPLLSLNSNLSTGLSLVRSFMLLMT